jgi:hypothetical protein
MEITFIPGTACGHGSEQAPMKLAIGIVVVVFALMWWLFRVRRRRENMSDMEVATVIEHYLYGGGGWDWGDFVEVRFKNPRLEQLRQACLDAESRAPDEREAVLVELMHKLRGGQRQ